MLTGAQIRMARGYMRWSVQELGIRSAISPATIKRMELVDGVPSSLGDTLLKVQRAFEEAGVEFIPENGGGTGVRLRKSGVTP